MEKENVMPPTPVRKKDEIIARAGILLVFFVFLIAFLSAYHSGANRVVTAVFGVIAVFCLWAVIFASRRIAIFVGTWLP